MGTITKEAAEHIIAHNGHYEDDLRASRIVTYENMFDGGLTYAVLYPTEDQRRYERSYACKNVQVIWQVDPE